MNRRNFLTAAGATLAAAGLTGCAGTASGARVPSTQGTPGRLKKAVKLEMVETDGSVLEKFRLLKAIGYDGVELERPSQLDRAEILEAHRETGLPVHGVVDSVHWRKTLGDPDAAVREEGLAGLRIALEDARFLGASTVLLVPAVVNDVIAYDDAWHRSQAEIRKALPYAEKNGVRIAIENVWNMFLMSPMEMARYVDELRSPWVGVYFDAGNVFNYGWPEQWVKILGPRILKVDVKGFSRSLRDKEGPWAGFKAEIGDDEVNWPAVRAALAAVQYQGWVTAEVGGGDETRLRDIAQRLDRHLLGV